MSVALARRHRAAQTALTSLLTLGVADLWRALVTDRGPREVWPVLYPQMAAMIQDQRARSADIARRFYAEARAEAGVPGEPPRVEVPRVPAEQMETSLAVTGLVSYERGIRSGRSPEEASEVAIVTVTGAAERLVADGGREAIAESVKSDSEAVAWYRLPGPDPCHWCAMLASRGAVYGSRRSASTTEDGDRYHDHCACEPWPVFSRGEELPPEIAELEAAWPEVTAGLSGPEAMKAWRKWIEERRAARRGDAGARPVRENEPAAAAGGASPPDTPGPGPAAGAADDDEDPPFGEVLGGPEERALRRRDEPRTGDNTPADVDFRYVEDPDERTTALLQYIYGGRLITEHVADNLRRGHQPFQGVDFDGLTVDGIDDELTVLWFLRHSRPLRPEHGHYDADELRKDILAAATRLNRWIDNPVRLPAVYKGMRVPAPVDELLRRYRPGHRETLNLSSFTSKPEFAQMYADSPGPPIRPTDATPVIFFISGARGVELSSVGTTAQSAEVILNGDAEVISSEFVDGRVEVVLRWIGPS